MQLLYNIFIIKQLLIGTDLFQMGNCLGDFHGYSFKLLRNTVAHSVSQLITLLGIAIMLKLGGSVRPQFELGRELQGKRAEVSPS